ncbi:hypothetical protein [Spirosoma pulveris]
MKNLPGQFSITNLFAVIIVFSLINFFVSRAIVTSIRSDIEVKKKNLGKDSTLISQNAKELKLLVNRIDLLNKEIITLRAKIHENDSSVTSLKKDLIKLKR